MTSLKESSAIGTLNNFLAICNAPENLCMCINDAYEKSGNIPDDLIIHLLNAELEYGYDKLPLWIHFLNMRCVKILRIMLEKVNLSMLKEIKNPYYKLQIFKQLGKINNDDISNFLIKLLDYYKCDYDANFVILLIRTRNPKIVNKVEELKMTSLFKQVNYLQTGNLSLIKKNVKNITEEEIYKHPDFRSAILTTGNKELIKDLAEKLGRGYQIYSRNLLRYVIHSNNLSGIKHYINQIPTQKIFDGSFADFHVISEAILNGNLIIFKYIIDIYNEDVGIQKIINNRDIVSEFVLFACSTCNYDLLREVTSIFQFDFNNFEQEMFDMAIKSGNVGIVKYIKMKISNLPLYAGLTVKLTDIITGNNMKLLEYFEGPGDRLNNLTFDYSAIQINDIKCSPKFNNIEIVKHIFPPSSRNNYGILIYKSILLTSHCTGNYTIVKYLFKLIDFIDEIFVNNLKETARKSSNECLLRYYNSNEIKEKIIPNE